jgi:nucleotide-binding universal stress UspA family protein
MSAASESVPFISSILHPSDFSAASELAFAHALAIALLRQTELVIMHAGGGNEDWAQFPAVRETLERWQVLPGGSPRSAVFDKLAVKVKKINAPGNALRACIDQIHKQRPDLVVLATGGRSGLPLWLKPSVAQAIAHRTTAMTLFVPRGCRGIVSMDGVIQLRRVLLPVDHQPSPQEAVIRAVRAAEALGDGAVEMLLLHVNGGELPLFDRPQSKACVWKELRREGEVVPNILDLAQQADLIIMATEGRHGVFDALRGSVTDRVVRDAPCPVLAIPIGTGDVG